MAKRTHDHISDSRGLERFDKRAAAYVAFAMTLDEYNAPLPTHMHAAADDFARTKHLVHLRLDGKVAGRLEAAGGIGMQNCPREIVALLTGKKSEVKHQVPASFVYNDETDYQRIKRNFEDDNHIVLVESLGKFAWFSHKEGKYLWHTEGMIKSNYKCMHYGMASKKPFITRWLTDATRPSRKDVDFWPSLAPEHDRPTVLNLFTGFAYERLLKDDSIEILTMDHEGVQKLFALWENVHGGPDGGAYSHKMMAVQLQQPLTPPRVGTVLGGEQGLGKDIFFTEMIGPGIVGNQYFMSVAKADRDVFGSFNSQLEGKVILHFEEIEKVPANDMKKLVTQTFSTINNKGVPQYRVDSYFRIVGSTNESSKLADYLGLEPGQRRYALLQAVSHEHKQNKAFFDEIAKLLHQDSVRKFFARYWLSLDVENFDPVGDRPRTRLMDVTERSTVPAEAQFLQYLSELPTWDESGLQHTETFKITTSGYWFVDINTMRERYNAWHSTSLGKAAATSSNQLSVAWNTMEGLVGSLKDMAPLVYRKFSDINRKEVRAWAFHRDKLREWLRTKKYVVQEDKAVDDAEGGTAVAPGGSVRSRMVVVDEMW
jgi:hypothetical protein